MTKKQKRILVKQWKSIQRNEPYELKSRYDPIVDFVETVGDMRTRSCYHNI